MTWHHPKTLEASGNPQPESQNYESVDFSVKSVGYEGSGCCLRLLLHIPWFKFSEDSHLEDNANIPSWVPGMPGIDKGTILFTYAKECFLGWPTSVG